MLWSWEICLAVARLGLLELLTRVAAMQRKRLTVTVKLG